MRQVHRAGEKSFVDYSGKRPRIVDQETGEVTEVELFVAVLGASNYTFAEATRTQRLADLVASWLFPGSARNPGRRRYL
jgi:transposase